MVTDGSGFTPALPAGPLFHGQCQFVCLTFKVSVDLFCRADISEVQVSWSV